MTDAAKVPEASTICIHVERALDELGVATGAAI
jgi:hypothetical protein